jgi:hypothetical protein
MVHVHSRPCYGSLFLSSNNHPLSSPSSSSNPSVFRDVSLLSWSSDSTFRYEFNFFILRLLFLFESFQKISHWSYGMNMNSEIADEPELTVHSSSSVKNFSPLICAQQPSSSFIYCGGETRSSDSSSNSHQKSFSFLGTPIHIFDVSEIRKTENTEADEEDDREEKN